jgi:hypothetical protein
VRLRDKTALFGVTYLVGGLLVMYVSFRLSGRFLVLPILVWFLVFGLLQFVILRCPSCGALAIRTKRGAYIPWTGTVCRYCNRPY